MSLISFMMASISSKSIRKILIPIDFSKTSEHAVDMATSIALDLNADLILFHAIDVPIVSSGDMVFVVDFVELEIEAKTKMERIKADILSNHPSLIVKTKLAKGSAAQEIVLAGSDLNIDLVVMGSNGHSAVHDFAIGSVTKILLANCKCPVLAVPLSSPTDHPAKVVFATNFDDHELQAIFLLSEIVRPFKSEILLVHVGESHDIKEQDVLLNYFRGQIHSNINYENISYHFLSTRDIEISLENFLKENKADWFSIAKRKRNLFDQLTSTSLTQKLHRHIEIPMLVFQTINNSGTPLFS